MRIPFASYGLKDLVRYELGLLAVAVALGAGALAWSAWLWLPAGAVVVVMAFVANFFRDPERVIPSEPRILVSPADGTITDIEHLAVGDPRNALDVPAVRIGMFLSLFNVHVNRSPADGRVTRLAYREGLFLPAYHARASADNESNTVWMTLADGAVPIAVKQISGVAARRIVCPLAVGDAVARGQRFGMIKFGSRTELTVPQDAVAEVAVRIGQAVRGGADVLVRLK